MRFLEYLATPEGLGHMMDELASFDPDPELLEDPALLDHAALRRFAACKWARDRGASAAGGVQALVLLVAFECLLLIERTRCRYKRRVGLGLLLFFARYVWPAYEVWVIGECALGAPGSVEACVPWLTTEGHLSRALGELGVANPQAEGFCLTAADLDKCEATHHGWVGQARLVIHAQVLAVLRDSDRSQRDPVAEAGVSVPSTSTTR